MEAATPGTALVTTAPDTAVAALLAPAVTVLAAAASLYTLVLAGAELGAPAPEFHVSRLNLTADLYGAGGPGLVLATALLAALAYSSLISLRVFQKSGSRRSSTFTYSIVMLGVQGTRTLGAILLAAGVQVSPA